MSFHGQAPSDSPTPGMHAMAASPVCRDPDSPGRPPGPGDSPLPVAAPLGLGLSSRASGFQRTGSHILLLASRAWRAGLRVAAAAVGIRDSPECQRRYINVAGTDRSQAGKGRVGLPAACGSLEAHRAPMVRRVRGDRRKPNPNATGDTRTCMQAASDSTPPHTREG